MAEATADLRKSMLEDLVRVGKMSAVWQRVVTRAHSARSSSLEILWRQKTWC